MSITEKLANLRDERLARKHACLQARDWIDGAMYDESQGVTMDAWALMVANELRRRSHRRKAA